MNPPMTPEQIYLNFTSGSAKPLHGVATEVGKMVDAYRAVADDLTALNNRMPNAWTGAAADGSTERSAQLIASVRESADLLASCARSHDAQAAAFQTARDTVQPVPPAPERPTPMDLAREIVLHGPAAPFERIQTYKDAAAAHDAAGQHNVHVMEAYYWATTDNLNMPTGYPNPSPPGSDGMTETQLDGMTEAQQDGMTEDRGDAEPESRTKKTASVGDTEDSGGEIGGTGGDFDRGDFNEGSGKKSGGSDDFDSGPPDRFDDLPPNPDHEQNDETTPSWVTSHVSPPNNVITDPPRNPPPWNPPPPVPDTPAPPGWNRDDRRNRDNHTDNDTDTTRSAGWDPRTGTADPTRFGTPPPGGSNWGAGADQSAGGQFGRGENAAAGGAAPGFGTSGSGVSRGFGPAGAGAGRTGGPGGMGMVPPGSNRDEDKEHNRPEYLFEPDPNAIFGTDQAASSPVIGQEWRPERFDEDED